MPNNKPFPVEVEAGKTYYWCTCGKTANEPLCNGAHKDSEKVPLPFKAEASETRERSWRSYRNGLLRKGLRDPLRHHPAAHRAYSGEEFSAGRLGAVSAAGRRSASQCVLTGALQITSLSLMGEEPNHFPLPLGEGQGVRA